MEIMLLLVVLLVITVVGHGIWVALAAFFRLFSGESRSSERPRRRPRERCVGCATLLEAWEHVCPSCGLHQEGTRAGRLRETAAIRHVRELLAEGVIAAETTQHVLAVLDERSKVLRAPPPPPSAPVTDHRALTQPGSPPLPIETVRVPPLFAEPLAVEGDVLEALPTEVIADGGRAGGVSPLGKDTASEISPLSQGADAPRSPGVASTPPRRLASVLSAFMEERNILWGELVGGLLIVGCSIALVLTLWHSLESLPYSSVLLFAALTASLFAAGQYTLHHWKLQSTSRGLLLIAMLLAPLNLLVLADPTARGAASDSPWVELAISAAALLAFVFMVRASGRDLIGTDVLPGPIDRRWLLAFAVIGAAGSQLLAPHVLDQPGGDLPSRLLLMAGLPTAFHLLACGAVLGGLTLYGTNRRVQTPQAHALFTFLALATFALLAAFAFLLSRLAHPAAGLHLLACPLIVAGVPGLVSGLVVFRRLEGEGIAGLRTAGTGVALTGVSMMLAGVALAWPEPVPLLAALLLAGAVLTVTALVARAEWIHAGALPCLTLAVLVGFYLVRGNLPAPNDPTRALLTLFASADSGALLVGIAIVFVGLGAYLALVGLAGQALALEWGAVSAAGTALVIATAHGLDRPLIAAAVHGAAVLAGVLLCLRWRSAGLAHVTVVLVVPATLWALWGLYPHQLALWGVVLAVEALMLAAAGSWRQVWNLPIFPASSKLAATEEGMLAALAKGAGQVALLTGALALLLAVFSGTFPHAVEHTITTAILSLALLVPALRLRSPAWFTAFQAGLIVTVLCGVTALAHPRGWLDDARGAQAYGAGLALLSLAWVAARRTMGRQPGLESLLPRSWMGLDRLLLGGLVIGSMVPAVVVASRAILAEWVIDSSTEVLPHLFGPGAWLIPGVLALALLALLIGPEQEGEVLLRRSSILGLVWLTMSAITWWAGMHIVDRAGASALRWGLAGCFLGGSILLWLRKEIAWLAGRVGVPALTGEGNPEDRLKPGLQRAAKDVQVLLGTSACVVVFLTMILTGLGFQGQTLPGSLPQSIFSWMGTVLCSIGPMVLLIAGLVGTALRDRSTGYALAAGLLTTATAMGGYALGIVQSGATFDLNQAVLTVLIGCTTAGVCGLAWLAAAHLPRLLLPASGGVYPRRLSWLASPQLLPGNGPLLAIQAWLGLAGLMLLAMTQLPGLLYAPGLPAEAHYLTLGGPVGWLALIVCAGAALWHTTTTALRSRVHVDGLVLLVSGILAGSFARQYDSATWWVSYHVMAVFWSAAAVLISVVGSLVPLRSRRWQVLFPARLVRPWLAGLALLLTIIAVRGMGGSLVHQNQVTPIVAALAASMLTGMAALWFRRGGLVYSSGLLFTLATYLHWLAWGAWGPDTVSAGALSIVIGLATSAAFWQAIALPQLRIDVTKLRWRGLPYSPVATAVALIVLATTVAVPVFADAASGFHMKLGWPAWASAAAVGVALLAALGDPASRLARPGLYVLGLTLAGMGLHALELPPERLAWAGALALAVHAGIASLLAWCWPAMAPESGAEPASRLKLPLLEREWPWFLPAQLIVAAAVALLGFGVAITLQAPIERLAGPLAIALLVPGALALSRVAPGGWRTQLMLASEVCAATALAALAWAVPDPAGVAPWLHRNAWLLAALTSACVLAMQVGGRLPAELHGAKLRQFGLVLGWLAVLLAPVLLGQMFPLFEKATRRTPLAGAAVACVALALVALMAQSLQLALRPARDPMKWTERGRTAYVYLAEVILVLLFLHVRLNVPELFTGLLAKYWTLIVLLLAFLGVGLSELCERNNLRVLAVPLQRTGIFLPLVPLVAFWARPQDGLFAFDDKMALMPQTFDFYALLWFLSAALYGAVAMTRRSVGWAIAAALAVNFGLWSMLMHLEVGFMVHPQAWLIPLGVIVLASEYINHDRLSREASQGLRYLGISLIYVASTTDLFLAGLGKSLWLPVILAVLCVLGVLAGILLRVRAFLFLGVGFLLVDVLAMIWHAAVDQAHTWLWWACGIVLGAAILALFAVFEKRRNDVLELLDRFRAWE
jgi:hypothetical protein